MNKSLLAHLAGRLAPSPETIATESLRYILNASPGVCQALVDKVAKRAGFEPFKAESIESETEVETGGRPDITIYDATSRPRVHIETACQCSSQATGWSPLLSHAPDAPADVRMNLDACKDLVNLVRINPQPAPSKQRVLIEMRGR